MFNELVRYSDFSAHYCLLLGCQLLTAVVNSRSRKDFSDALTTLKHHEAVYQHFVDNWLPYEEDLGLYNFAGVRTLFNEANNRLEWYACVMLKPVVFNI